MSASSPSTAPRFQSVDIEGEPIRDDVVSSYPIPLYTRPALTEATVTDDLTKALFFASIGFAGGFLTTALVCLF